MLLSDQVKIHVIQTICFLHRFCKLSSRGYSFLAIVSLTTKDKVTGASKDTTVAILSKGHSFGVRVLILAMKIHNCRLY